MKPPWDHSGQSAAELEALQTDVMRFVAILGLCLAAIFSLVNGAQHEPREPLTAPAAEPVEKALSQPSPATRAVSSLQEAARPQAAAPSLPAPVVVPENAEQQPGFTLEFDSGGTLDSLLAADRIQLFARAGGIFYRYRRGGDFQQADAPVSYYRMDPNTVPRGLRLRGEGLLGGPIEWGVTLPAVTVREVQRLMSEEEGGNLLIDARADVRLVSRGN